MKEEFAWSAARDIAHTLVQQKSNTQSIDEQNAQNIASFITTLANGLLKGYDESARNREQGGGQESQSKES